jgi:folate-binding protein YgfZ
MTAARSEEAFAAARQGAAAGPVLARGLLRFAGKDGQDFLHRMSTQRVNGLAPGAAVHAGFLNAKGHVLAEGMLVARFDDVLLDVHEADAAALREHLLAFVIMDDVEIEDVSAAFRVLPVLGPRGPGLLRERPEAAASWANPRRGAPAVDVLVAAGDAEALRAALLAAGAADLSEGELEALRIAAGVPRSGAEVDRSRLPMEAALVASAVSFDKGCYLGQEVVLRGTFRGQVQKGLVQLALPEGAGPGAPLRAGEQEVGVVTSAADTPEGRLGLGYLRRAHWHEGARLATAGGEAVVLRVLVTERDP